MRSPGFLRLLILALLPLSGFTVRAAPLTASQVATLAYNAGFRGGSLVMAVAAASAESNFEPNAVCNNLIITVGGVPQFRPDGKPLTACLSNNTGTLLPLSSSQTLPDSRTGTVTSYCRGLWQINSVMHPLVTNTVAFTPESAARCAWEITRKGRDWGRWVSLRNGTALQSARIAQARTAAAALDPGVLPASATGQRVESWLDGGYVRNTAGGTKLRFIRKQDTGTVLAGPVIASVTENTQISQRLWYQVQWDHGTTGWVVEEYLRRSTAAANPPATAATLPFPATNSVRLPLTGFGLSWHINANTASVRLYFGTTPALNGAGDLKLSGGLQEAWTLPALNTYTNYYWRVDSLSRTGTVTTGTLWTYRTLPPAYLPVTMSNLAGPGVATIQGQTFQMSGKAAASGAQALLIGASIVPTGGNSVAPRYDDALHTLNFTTPANGSAGSWTRQFTVGATVPPGSYDLIIASWQDVNGDGKIAYGDVRMTCHRLTGAVYVMPPPDLTLPVIHSFTLSAPTLPPGQQLAVNVRVSDAGGSGLQRVALLRAAGDSPPAGPWQEVSTQPLFGNGPQDVVFYDTPFLPDRFWYGIRLMDGAGNERRETAPLTCLFAYPDTRPPTFTWQSPQNGSTVPSIMQLTGYGSDDDAVGRIEYRLNGGDWEIVTGNGINVNVTPLAGPNTIEGRARDRSGKYSAISTLLVYWPGPSNDPTVFDETITFNFFGLPNGWTQTLPDPPDFVSGVVNGRLQASGNNASAAISKLKQPPAWATSVEAGFTAETNGSLRWQDTEGNTWQIQLRYGSGFPQNWEVTAGTLAAPQMQSVPRNGNSPGRLFAVLQDGRIGIRITEPGSFSSQPPPELTFTLPALRVGNLRQATLLTESGDNFYAAITGGLFRALRPENAFAIRSLQPAQFFGWDVEWTSFANRQYSIEQATSPAGPWQQIQSHMASGIISRTGIFLQSGQNNFVRVRQTDP